jgi:hypothetical protein
VCDSFQPDTENPPFCAAYVAGANPVFHKADVTQGRGADFAEGLPQLLAGMKTPRKSFSRALKRLSASKPGKAKKSEWGIELEDGSVDFITSAMVASQFDFEPFSYFICFILNKYGNDTVRGQANSLAQVETDLRNGLFRWLMEGHCLEMCRLLRPGGQIYFSAEMAYRQKGAAGWFQPETVPTMMELIGRYFQFDIRPDLMTPDIAEDASGGASLIQSYVLQPKPLQ